MNHNAVVLVILFNHSFIFGDGKTERHLVGITAPDFSIQLPPDVCAVQACPDMQTVTVCIDLQCLVPDPGIDMASVIILHDYIMHVGTIKRLRRNLLIYHVIAKIVEHITLVECRSIALDDHAAIVSIPGLQPGYKDVPILSVIALRHCFRLLRPDWP